MPIRASERARYPKDWKAIRAEVLNRAGLRCECMGECGKDHRQTSYFKMPRCEETHGSKAEHFRGKVILTIAHRDHTPENNGTPGNRPNLAAWCQACHLRYDSPIHIINARATREKKNPTPRLL